MSRFTADEDIYDFSRVCERGIRGAAESFNCQQTAFSLRFLFA